MCNLKSRFYASIIIKKICCWAILMIYVSIAQVIPKAFASVFMGSEKSKDKVLYIGELTWE